MSLSESISDITAKLRQGRFPNEQSISQGIVLRLLQDLGWTVYDTNIVWPEFQTGEGRADFALCYPASKPCVFIEVKQPGNAEIGVRQALEYAFHTGVQFIVLTDGKTWSFYLPAEQGSYEDRRVYKLDLFEREPDEAAQILMKYLSHARSESGQALEDARKEYRNRNRRSVARLQIPEAWHELVCDGDDTLVELVSNAVESKAGFRPDDDDVLAFLSTVGRGVQFPVDENKSNKTAKKITGKEVVPLPPAKADSSNRSGTLILRGKSYPYANAKAGYLTALSKLAESDATFLQRLSKHPTCSGRKRQYIARTPQEMYPDRPDLWEKHEIVGDGWLVATNMNNQLKKTVLRAAAEVAGLSFGHDLSVEF